MTEEKKDLLQLLKESPRYGEAILKLGTASGFLNNEEIALLNLLMQIEAQSENRAQIKAAMELTKETIGLSENSVKMAGELAQWTKRLAIATFVLAAVALLGIFVK